MEREWSGTTWNWGETSIGPVRNCSEVEQAGLLGGGRSLGWVELVLRSPLGSELTRLELGWSNVNVLSAVIFGKNGCFPTLVVFAAIRLDQSGSYR